MANYTRERSKYGGAIGTIQILTSSLFGYNGPLDSKFKSVIPAGYLKCDGRILLVKDYPALAAVIGEGPNGKFVKESKKDLVTSDKFMLPDLGSKVIVGGTGTGAYQFDKTEDGAQTKVGSNVNVTSNVGSALTINYNGNFTIPGQSNIGLLGNPKYIIASTVDEFILDESNFQSHGHDGNQTVLNYTGNHAAGQSGNTKVNDLGNGGSDNASSIGGNVFEETSSNNVNVANHTHKITKPSSYTHNFTYAYNTFNASAENLTTTVNISTKSIKKVDEAVSPFILVEYIIKF